MADDQKPTVELGVFPGLADAAKDLLQPVYEDAVQPAARKFGRTLETVMGSVNTILMPLSVTVYAFEQIETLLKEGVARRVHSWGTKDEDLRTPPPNVVVPAIEALRYSASIDELREMFLTLIATSMDATRGESVHPSFVEVLKQLSADEGRILSLFFMRKDLYLWSMELKRNAFAVAPQRTERTFLRLSLIGKDAGCQTPAMIPAYVDNLLRLGLVYEPKPVSSHATIRTPLRDPQESPYSPGYFLRGERIGELVDQHPELDDISASLNEGDDLEVWTSAIRLTEFGKAFCRSCVDQDDPHGLLTYGAEGEYLMGNRIPV